MTEQKLNKKASEIYGWCSNGINQPTACITDIENLAKSYAASQVSTKDARIQELEFVIEYAASSLDLIHPDDSDFSEKLNKIYQNLENKTRYEV
jgi:hypothetical protein